MIQTHHSTPLAATPQLPAAPPQQAPAAEGPRDTFTPSQPVMLAQAQDPAQRVIDTVDPLTNLPQFPGNPSMPYFPGGYNPTSPTAPASLLNQVATPVNNRIGNALNPHQQQEHQMVQHLLGQATRQFPNLYSMSRQQALTILQGQYGHLGAQRLNSLLDNLADQTSNAGLFQSERASIYADDILRFLTNRRY